MTLIKTSLLNGIAVVIKMLTLLGINKILAIYVGPAGYAAIGQFQNAVQMITTFASGAISTGVVKYTAEYHDNEEKQRTVWRTAGTISLTGAIVTGILVALFSKVLSTWFLKDESYSSIFIWFAITLVLFVLNTLLLAILNGKKEIHSYVLANIAGSLFALIVTSFMAVKFGLYGALLALALYQSLSFFITFYLCYKLSWFEIRILFGSVERKTVIKLAKFSAMAFTSAACVPATQMLIRTNLLHTLGVDAAGYWEAMLRLSAAYLLFVSTTLTVYFLPKFSEISDFNEIKKEIISGYKLILPIVVLFGSFIYFFRENIITLMFTKDFLKMEVLFFWQMIGDLMKIASFIIGFVFLSKAKFKLFMFIEVYFSIQYYVLSLLFIDYLGLEGVALSYFVNYLICFLFVLYVFFARWGDNVN